MARGRGSKRTADTSATSLQAQTQKMIKGTQSDDTEELMNLLQGRPEVVSHVLKLLKKGAFDATPEQDVALFVPSCNKLYLLNKDQYILPMLCKLVPDYEDWIMSQPKKIRKESWLKLFAYLLFADEQTALPCKQVEKFEEWAAARFRSHVENLFKNFAPEPSRSLTLETLEESLGYWDVQGSDLVCYPSKRKCPLPAELAAVADKLEIQNNLSFWKARVVHGCMSVLCSSVFKDNVEDWDTVPVPYFRKDMTADEKSETAATSLLTPKTLKGNGFRCKGKTTPSPPPGSGRVENEGSTAATPSPPRGSGCVALEDDPVQRELEARFAEVADDGEEGVEAPEDDDDDQ